MRERGKFPSQPVPSPKGQFVIGNSSGSTQVQKHVQSIVTLRLGRQVDNKVSMPVEDDLVRSEKKESQINLAKIPEPTFSHPTAIDPIRNFVPRAPFPHRLATPKKVAQFEDILEVFKQVHINIPLLDAIQQVPSYAKFLKDLCHN